MNGACVIAPRAYGLKRNSVGGVSDFTVEILTTTEDPTIAIPDCTGKIDKPEPDTDAVGFLVVRGEVLEGGGAETARQADYNIVAESLNALMAGDPCTAPFEDGGDRLAAL